MRCLFALILSGAIVVPTHSALSDGNWLVSQEHAACFLDNIAGYAELGGNPVFIELEDCPIESTEEMLRALQQNSGAQPRVTVTSESSELASTIVYSASELECLLALEIDRASDPVVLPRDPCG